MCFTYFIFFHLIFIVQRFLLQESWKELFLLNLAQWSVPFDLGAVLDSQQVRERIPNDALTASEMKTIQEILCRFRQISPDSSEVGCMKAIVLFSPETPALCDVQPVEMLQDQGITRKQFINLFAR